MAALSPDEVAVERMQPAWAALEPIRARDAALTQFLREELPPGVRFDPAGMTAALQLTTEFNDIWAHYVPTRWELVIADRAGRLGEKIAELNTAYQEGK